MICNSSLFFIQSPSKRKREDIEIPVSRIYNDEMPYLSEKGRYFKKILDALCVSGTDTNPAKRMKTDQKEQQKEPSLWTPDLDIDNRVFIQEVDLFTCDVVGDEDCDYNLCKYLGGYPKAHIDEELFYYAIN